MALSRLFLSLLVRKLGPLNKISRTIVVSILVQMNHTHIYIYTRIFARFARKILAKQPPQDSQIAKHPPQEQMCVEKMVEAKEAKFSERLSLEAPGLMHLKRRLPKNYFLRILTLWGGFRGFWGGRKGWT